MGSDYPSKPMSLYSTIWDGSTWATQGGRYHVNYRFQPFTAEFKDLVLLGCPVNPSIVSITTSTSNNCSDKIADLEANPLTVITVEGRKSMRWFRRKFMYYSYCYDTVRYPTPPPECVIVMEEQNLFKETGRLKNIRFVQHRNHRSMRKRSSRVRRKESLRRRKETTLSQVVEPKKIPSLVVEVLEPKDTPSPAVEPKETPSPAVEPKEIPSPAVEPKETTPPPPPHRRRFRPAPPEATASGFL
ncbi:probable xyloglucan endotransglucosylase/hydrolase protein 30 [Impatiens glandulifera]|uniref:probable xyloglucan endotransglucosylase/hydrolase protein 30 n=1 Tax=Impatiens glandulifera TaxID=253017 RepID=UPI001FB0898B|nr:probable xyloglucan endotransglucosylase/hydrolase protein 30 [Impatiens glandulifera]